MAIYRNTVTGAIRHTDAKLGAPFELVTPKELAQEHVDAVMRAAKIAKTPAGEPRVSPRQRAEAAARAAGTLPAKRSPAARPSRAKPKA